MNPVLKKSLKIVLELVIYVGIFGGLLWGLPKGLSNYLKTPYPMAAITSGSMWPALAQGDLVFIRGQQTKETIAVGDVVVWRGEDSKGFVIHRVIEMREDTFITKGDANFTDDEPVRYEQLVGKAIALKNGKLFHIPYLGTVTTFASKQLSQ